MKKTYADIDKFALIVKKYISSPNHTDFKRKIELTKFNRWFQSCIEEYSNGLSAIAEKYKDYINNGVISDREKAEEYMNERKPLMETEVEFDGELTPIPIKEMEKFKDLSPEDLSKLIDFGLVSD